MHSQRDVAGSRVDWRHSTARGGSRGRGRQTRLLPINILMTRTAFRGPARNRPALRAPCGCACRRRPCIYVGAYLRNRRDQNWSDENFNGSTAGEVGICGKISNQGTKWYTSQYTTRRAAPAKLSRGYFSAPSVLVGSQ